MIDHEITIMSKKGIIEYYEKIGQALVPFFEERKAFIRQRIHDKIIFRRYVSNKEDIRINQKEDVLHWAKWNAIAFFGTLERDDGTIDFVVDVDRHGLSLRLAALASRELYEIFRDYGLRPSVNFSGGGGFHFWLTFEKVPFKDRFKFHRRVVDFLQRKLERRLQDSELRDEFYKTIPEGMSITTSVTKEKAGMQIVLDRATNRKNGCIRAPYSLHDNGKYVCLPLSPKELRYFDEKIVTKENAIKRFKKTGYDFKIPRLRASKLLDEVKVRWNKLEG